MKKIALFVAVCCALSACKKDETAKTAAVKNDKNQITQSAPKDTMPQAYRDLINGKIKQAIFFSYDTGEDNPDDELSNLRDVISQNYIKPEDVYFSLKDVDNNGIDELIIGDGSAIFVIYTLDNQGNPKYVTHGKEKSPVASHLRYSWHLLDDNTFSSYGASSFQHHYYGTYYLSGDKMIEINYCFTASVNKKTGKKADSTYDDEKNIETAEFCNTTGEHDIENSKRQKCSYFSDGICTSQEQQNNFNEKKTQELEYPLLPEIELTSSSNNNGIMSIDEMYQIPEPIKLTINPQDSKNVVAIKKQYNESVKTLKNNHIKKFTVFNRDKVMTSERDSEIEEGYKRDFFFDKNKKRIFFSNSISIGLETYSQAEHLWDKNTGELILLLERELSAYGDGKDWVCYFKNNEVIHQENVDWSDFCMTQKQKIEEERIYVAIKNNLEDYTISSHADMDNNITNIQDNIAHIDEKKLYAESDKELNKVYQDLQKQISKNTGEQLKKAELKWIKYRDSFCNKEFNVTQCKRQKTDERTQYLQDRLRECKVGVCDKLAIIDDTHWYQ
ncbi:MAG: DUF1311 domain-containing protein [Neisseriaceae bacterium]|nr:DUF1311 domain-containing protein [Neisseriaceae bacterium]